MASKRRLKVALTPIGEKLLTLREAAGILRMNPRTLRAYLRRREIEGRIIGGKWRLRHIDLDLDHFYEDAPRNWGFKGKDEHEDWMVEQGKRARGWHQRYLGARGNCEGVSRLLVGAVAWVLDDPRHVPYLKVWKDQRSEKVIEVVRVCAYSRRDSLDWTGWVEVKRTDGSRVLIRTIERPLPRNGGKVRFVVCPLCQKPRRALYGWKVNRIRANSVFLTSWECRECNRLRYAYEGGALRLRPFPIVLKERLFVIRENAPRLESCRPYVFVNPQDAKAILPGT